MGKWKKLLSLLKKSLHQEENKIKPFLEELEKTVALLVFEDFSNCPVAELLDISQRLKTASEVNVLSSLARVMKKVLEALKSSTSSRTAIFAMSNPTKNAECTPGEAFLVLGGDIIFVSGSPFKDVDLGDGRIGHCNQGNNMYLFPRIGLGTLLSGSHIIYDGMLQDAAECLA